MISHPDQRNQSQYLSGPGQDSFGEKVSNTLLHWFFGSLTWFWRYWFTSNKMYTVCTTAGHQSCHQWWLTVWPFPYCRQQNFLQSCLPSPPHLRRRTPAPRAAIALVKPAVLPPPTPPTVVQESRMGTRSRSPSTATRVSTVLSIYNTITSICIRLSDQSDGWYLWHWLPSRGE